MTTNEADKLRKRIRNKAYMKEYRKKNNLKKKLTTNEADKLRERIKNKAYIKEFRKKNSIKKNLTTNEGDKLRKRIKNKQHVKDYRKRTTFCLHLLLSKMVLPILSPKCLIQLILQVPLSKFC